jgi:TonB family protein
VRRIFLWGLAFSLLVHLIIGSIVASYRPPRVTQPEQLTVARVRVISIATATPKPTPTPSPKPAATPKPTATPHEAAAPPPLRLNVPRASAVAPKMRTERRYIAPPRGSENGAPGATGNAARGNGSGTRGSGSGAACANPNVPAHVIQAVDPDYPDSAAQQHVYGTVLVAVTLADSGAVVSTIVQKSSGNEALDTAALHAAQASQYAPDLINCRPVGGTYIFRAIFEPD